MTWEPPDRGQSTFVASRRLRRREPGRIRVAPVVYLGRIMRIQAGQLVSLGYGKYARSDDVIAVEPITEGRGPGRRSLVWIRGLPDPMVASRAEGSIVDDLVTPADVAARMKAQRSVIRKMIRVLDDASPGVRRVLDEESGMDLSDLIDEANQVLG